jgi:hypothetical protein
VNPWTIIGWTLIAAAILVAARRLWTYLINVATLVRLMVASVKTPPANGQVWLLNGKTEFTITEVSDNGVTGRASLVTRTFTMDEWAALLKAGRALLVTL